MTMNAKEAVERLVALKELTEATGVKTHKTQNTLLASLSPEVLMEVALELKKFQAVLQALSVKPNSNTNLEGTGNVCHTAK